MAMETLERRGVVRPQQMGAPLPCPRCTSTNTKFCYYNNYNFSQPRHFCKSCRRYWTHGGTLRDIPVGGGSRKTAKRSRTTSAVATSTSTLEPPPPPIPAATQRAPVFVSLPLSGGTGGFTSLLSGGGFGLGLGLGLGLDDLGYGLNARGVWGFPHQHDDVGLYVNCGGSGESESRSDTWQMESGEHCFTATATLPELAISTQGMVSSELSSPNLK